MSCAVHEAAELFGFVVIGYFCLLNGVYLAFTAIAWRGISQHLALRASQALEEAVASPLTPPISVLLPAYNEQAGVVEAVSSLLSLRYSQHEVIVINDGSTDDTLAVLTEAYELVPAPLALRETIAHAPVRGTYLSRRDPQLMVIDKDNGGKADALNAGVCAARYPYLCAVDGDALLEPDALLRVAKPVLDNPDQVVATGGIVRIVNGCRVTNGRLVEVRLPRNRLAILQVVEYFRAFLVGRTGWSAAQALLIISGAFGLFRRATVEEVGGWRLGTVGEDMELVVRIHHQMRAQRRPYRLEFVPDPVCWTEAPERLGDLQRQRRRWQRGLAESLWHHRGMLLNPRYGAVGLLAMPYFLVFELLGPLVSGAGYVIMPVAAIGGWLSWPFLLAFLIVAVLLGQLLSISALALEEFSFARHRSGADAWRLLLYAALENLGYRQLTDYWRMIALWDVARRKQGWGKMTRRGFERVPES